MLNKTIEVLNFIGMPPKMAVTLLSIIIGFSLALAILPPYMFIKDLSSKVENMETNVVHKVDSLLTMVNTLDDTQQVLIEYTIDSSKTAEYTTNQLVEILKEVAHEERVKIIISEKKKAIDQYQQDHLPHNRAKIEPKKKFIIGIKPIK
ncbi:hypothetical protein [Plebeiibacterium sediminum]|uniref:Uncharacterized protein n=1 Tax=Plebeiibacterium sediminum TaxID=2992112 RepID=A0AAE3M1C7_9BACT|nr:hypothetical protein [Plebeiobacterium sediminum]MCW3784945.1 hypothetical protein [Plebeiobacterium sediminum]